MQGAVNITVVNGVLSAERAKAMSSRGRQVCGVGVCVCVQIEDH